MTPRGLHRKPLQFSRCTDGKGDDPGLPARKQRDPDSNPWLLDLRSSFSHSENVAGPPEGHICRPGAPNAGQGPWVTLVFQPDFPFSTPRTGRRLSYRETMGPGNALELLFIRTQAALRSHLGSVLCCRKERHFLQLRPLQSPAVASESPPRDVLALSLCLLALPGEEPD